MRTIISVTKERLARADYSITVIRDSRQVRKYEIKGDSGQAAAYAVNIAAKEPGSKIIGSDSILQKIPDDFDAII